MPKTQGDRSFFFFQAEDGIRAATVTGVRRVLFRSQRDAEVAQIKRIAGQRVGALGIQLLGDERLALSGGSVGDLPQHPGAQRLAEETERNARDEPRRMRRAAAAPEE